MSQVSDPKSDVGCTLFPEDLAMLHTVGAIFKMAPLDICFLQGPRLVYAYLNESCKKSIYNRDALGRSVYDVLPELAGEDMLKLLQQAYNNGESIVRYEAPVQIRGDNGTLSIRYFTYLYQPWRDATGKVQGVISAAVEATDAVVSKQKIEQERIQQDAWFRMLSHDLRNPIGSAKMGMDAIARMEGLEEKVYKKAQRASAALNRADSMLSRFLDMRTLQAGKTLPVSRSKQALSRILPALVEEWNLACSGRIRLHLDDEGLGLWDTDYMARALGNLVENAKKYGYKDTPIDVHLEKEDGYVLLRVCNQGDVISDQARLAIVTPTPWRAEGNLGSHEGGWGMGSLLVHAVVSAHQGSLLLKSEAQQTTFCLRFSETATSE